MKNILTLILFLYTSIAYSQNNWCGFDYQMQQAYAENPNLKNQIYEHFDRIANGQIVLEDRTDPIIIPVVVHIIHDGEIGNISDAQVYDAIRMLNEDYNKLNADTVDTRNTANAPFKPIAANINIQYKLAKIDPNGNCTNGIERRSSILGTYNANDNKTKYYTGGGLDAWDRNKYFNIWVVNSIENTGSTGTILGYGQFPMWGSADTYGFIVRHDAFGSIGTSSGDRTVTHELGHCLGLFHTFQGGCGSNSSSCSSQGDGCCDTPPVNDPHWSCSNTQNYCNQVPNGDNYGFDAYDQYENYMSYSPCQNMFSQDQKAIIEANFASIGFMQNLASLSNQIATGVTLPDVLCSAKFTSNTRVICEGDSILYSDISYHGISNRLWNFDNGTPISSLDSSVYVTYNNPGTFPVTLNISDGSNSVLIDSNNYVAVLPNPGHPLPYIQGFENLSVFPDFNNFFNDNTFSNINWELNTNVSAGGSNSISLNNYSNTTGSSNGFTSTSIDLTSVDPSEELLFSFDYAYRKKDALSNDRLKIFGTTDCGKTWVLFKTISATQFSTLIQSQPYTPNQSDWENITFTLYSLFQSNNQTFRFKFIFESEGGNNFYIDNINIFPTSQLNVVENNNIETVSLYPNPTKNSALLKFYSTTTQTVSIDIYNSLGEIIQTVYTGSANTGSNQYSIETTTFEKGIYYININGDNISKTIKIIKN
jgi:hypothetical protein